MRKRRNGMFDLTGITNRGDPVTEIIARKIIELAQQGERDLVQLRERAIDFLSRQVGG